MSEKRNRKPLAVFAGLAAAIALSSCSTASATPEGRDGLSPAERYEYDFVYIEPTGNFENGGRRCMMSEPYSSQASRAQDQAVLMYDPDTQVLSVTPSYGSVLRVTGFDDTDSFLSPADKTSLNILDTYGCEHGPLIEVPEPATR